MNVAKQPLYYPYYEVLYKDLLGGKVISHFEQARVAAGMLLDVFNGKEISTIPCVLESPNQYVVNYNVLKKFGLDENKLPEGTILLNKEESFFRITSYNVCYTKLLRTTGAGFGAGAGAGAGASAIGAGPPHSTGRLSTPP